MASQTPKMTIKNWKTGSLYFPSINAAKGPKRKFDETVITFLSQKILN